MLFDFSDLKNVEEVLNKTDEIRAELKFKSREECLHIIYEVMYRYGVETGCLNKSAVDSLLCLYRERATDEELERITVICLYKNELNQQENEINNVFNANENGI